MFITQDTSLLLLGFSRLSFMDFLGISVFVLVPLFSAPRVLLLDLAL